MERLEWNKSIVGSAMEITRGKERLGTIRWNNFLSSKATAEFRGKVFYLNRDIFGSLLEISDDKALLGRLNLSLFNPGTDVILNGKRFELEMKNFWQSRWAWKFNGIEVVTFTSNEFITRDKGVIELFSACNEEVEILILLGLVMRIQYILVILLLLVVALLIVL
jgi:hypothetical protein